jgi:hypothetical protein
MDARVRGLERPLLQWGVLLLCVVLIALGAWSIVRVRALRSQIGTLGAAARVAERRTEELDRELARERAAREAFALGLQRERAANEKEQAAVAAFTLTPGLPSSGVPDQRLVLPPGIAAAQIELVTPRRAPQTYRVGVRPFSGGEELWSHARLRPRTRDSPLLVIVPSEVLAPGRYELTLSVTDAAGRRQEAGTYVFEVVPK